MKRSLRSPLSLNLATSTVIQEGFTGFAPLSSLTRLDGIVLALVGVLGLVHLPYPFHGDQAFFTVGAAELSRGEVLYRDYWDLKQPGIFYFYQLAGTLFGFHEMGIHALEWFYMMGFSVVLLLTLQNYFRSRAIASLTPLFTVGVYYSVVSVWHLTQLEALVGFPIFLSLWFSYSPLSTSETCGHGQRKIITVLRFLLAGCMGGLVLLFKFMFLLVLLPLWFLILLDQVLRRREPVVQVITRKVLPLILGVLLPLFVVTLHFAQVGTLEQAYETFFVYPPRIVAELPGANLRRLLDGMGWFLSRFAPVIVLAFWTSYGVLRWRRSSLQVGTSECFTLALWTWCVAGLCVVLLQRQAWWQYHYLLVFVPVGILAVKGLESFLLDQGYNSFQSRIKVLVLSIVFLLSFITLSPFVKGSFILVKNGFAITPQSRLTYQSDLSPQYPKIRQAVQFLSEPESLPGDIYVAGDPLFYYLSGRRHAIALNGWALEFFLSEQWQQLTAQLEQAQPAYVLLDSAYSELILKRSPTTLQWLHQHYLIDHTDEMGAWYRLRSARLEVSNHS